LDSINVCLAKAPNIQVELLKQLHTSLTESRMMTAEQVLGSQIGLCCLEVVSSTIKSK
jgi:hypothetical protein